MKNKIITIVTFTILIFIWYIASLDSNPLFIPNPLVVWDNLLQLIKNGKIWINIWYTFKRILIGTCISGMISVPLGLLIHNNKIAQYTIHPVVSLFRYVPVTAFYPLLMMWMGIGEQMKIAFYVIATSVYMIPSVTLALDEVNEDLIDTGLTIGMNRLQTITRIQLPSTLPSIMNSFIMMFGIGFTYSAVVESINSKYGLGWIVQQSSSRGRTDMVFMAIIIIMIISFLFDNISKKLVKFIFKWRYLHADD